MSRRAVALMAVLAAVGQATGCQGPAPAPAASRLAAGAQGTIAFESRTIPAPPLEAFADGPRGDARSVIRAELVFPERRGRRARPHPAIVHLHGSAGPQPHHEDLWLERFRTLGFATFRIDSFGGRGVTETIGAQARVSSATLAADAFSALRLLRTHPRVDAARIGVMGESKGGSAALLAAKAVWRRQWVRGPGFAFHIALYPFCAQLERPDVDAPVLVLVGERDDFTGVRNCERLVAALQRAGVDAAIRVYENAFHGFDSGSAPYVLEKARRWGACRWRLSDDGSAVDLNTGRRLASGRQWRDAIASCTRPGGATVAGNTAAREQALRDMERFLTRVAPAGAQAGD